jgi:UDP-N-acetylmuramoylalanine--D-glutamate ligase
MNDWSGQRVVILGAARQGLALARYLAEHGAQVVLNDRRPCEELDEAQAALAGLAVEWICGHHPASVLDGAQRVFISGGVALTLPLVAEALRRGIPLSNDSEIFLEAAACPVIGITGSAGKTTTTTLVGRMAVAAYAGRLGRVVIGGNIGNPLITELDRLQAHDLAVMELSSFQLEIMTRSPQVAAILNITPNHLDRHGTMEAYMAAKEQILEHQNLADVAVLNREDPGAWELVGRVRGRLLTFSQAAPRRGDGTYVLEDMLTLRQGGQDIPLLPRGLVRLRGEHNLLNVLAACAISAAAGLPPEAMRAGVEGFNGVPHRLEFVRRWGGADWYNDSIATAPERAMAAIRSFDEPLVLLAGGRDKKLPWEDFAALVHRRVDHLVLFGEAAEMIAAVMGQALQGQRPHTVQLCAGLEEAVQAAAGVVSDGDVVLLSPGGTSFDQFRDFEERGEWYKRWVMQL